MTDQPRNTSALVDALRTTVAAAPETLHPSRLRLLVEDALGPEQSRALRREIHQVVVAAEEHLPTRMSRISPLTAASLVSLSTELAGARGWSLPTAERTTRTWAAALGFDDLAVTNWPPPVQIEHPPSRPPVATSAPVDDTALPPEPVSLSAGTPVAEAPWPKPAARLRKLHERSITGEPVLGVVQAYSGMPLALFIGAGACVLLALVIALFLLPPIGAGIATAAAALGARALVVAARYGALAASDSGLEFTPYVLNMRRPKADEAFTVRWHDVQAEVGTISVVVMGGRRIQVGPRNRAFAEAVAGVVRTRP